MKKIGNLLNRVDEVVDQKMNTFWNSNKRYLPLFGITLIAVMVGVIIWRSVQHKPDFIASIIRNDVKKIAQVIQSVDEKCGIVRFVHERGYVDFLTVEKFVGSDIGGLTLARPKNWQGPYVKENPALYDKLYEIVLAQDGFYVVPGYGVELPNGFIMGEDIVITPDVPVELMLKQGASLNYHGAQLAARISFATGKWDDRIYEPKKLKKTEKLIKEFDEAMTYTD